ncbi:MULTISPECIES: hypothetical protein [Microbacterium]|uniref:hypothetical protein n=1 Tax=Microbacterium TaxID=33882 RepID=UPI0027823466|nr:MULTISPECIES: hypothetical protein [Microbacterium]MDQ1084481.1 hypothetical protein [Microbacterium sp. SORGH_AS_0344]MDQ1170242.1 hypothetical protein [Microbacterium proteolyticum]
MDELTLLRSTRDDTLIPSQDTLDAGRAALMARIAQPPQPAHLAPARRRRRPIRRATWIAAGTATALTGILIAGNINLGVQSAQASEVLRQAAAATLTTTDAAIAPGQYLRSITHARWLTCTNGVECVPNDQFLDVYKPVDPGAEWVLVRDWGELPGLTGTSMETNRAVGGFFYGPDWSWQQGDVAAIPLDGAEAYAWIDSQYQGGSASREEDNFVRITDILRSGLVPAPQRAALLDALARIPGVTSAGGVQNLDGVSGVAIGRVEPMRLGERQEIIIDPATGLVIGERTVVGAQAFGWSTPDAVTELTAITTTVVDEAP